MVKDAIIINKKKRIQHVFCVKLYKNVRNVHRHKAYKLKSGVNNHAFNYSTQKNQ